MDRGEFESVVRWQITRCVANALHAGVPSTRIMNQATDEILASADAYALELASPADDPHVTARRRELLAAAAGAGRTNRPKGT